MAEMQYNSSYPQIGFTCDIGDLGGEANQPVGQSAAHLLPPELASGKQNGYIFSINNCMKVTLPNGQSQITTYQVTAVPQIAGKTGNRGFCSDVTGEILADPRGGRKCTEPVK